MTSGCWSWWHHAEQQHKGCLQGADPTPPADPVRQSDSVAFLRGLSTLILQLTLLCVSSVAVALVSK